MLHPSQHQRREAGMAGVASRRGKRLALPAVTLSTVTSLSFTVTDLAAVAEIQQDYRQSSLFGRQWLLTEDSTGTMRPPLILLETRGEQRRAGTVRVVNVSGATLTVLGQ